MGRAAPSHLVVGHLNKAHGTKGELFVWPLTDHPGATFAPGVILYLADETGNVPDSSRPSLRVQAARPFRRGYLIRFEGVGDRSGAEVLQGRYLVRPLEELEGLEEGEVFYHDLLGMRVETVSGEVVGTITEVYELRPADLLEVQGDSRTVHIPFLGSIVRRIDLPNRTLVIDPPEGLLEL